MGDAAAVGTARSNGLDTLRAAAIALVFGYHYRIFVSDAPDLGAFGIVGWVGVDLFFVLSGYLIANQLFAGHAAGQKLSLGAFYARRALRTLPVFWVMLALYFSFPAEMGGRTPPPLWRFLTFTQNFNLPPGTAFSHAWSLCIEEQFYLVLPLALLAGWRLGAGRWLGWATLAALMALGITARALLWQRYGTDAGGQLAGYHPNIYYATLCRFDEFLPGVAMALLKNFHAPLWGRITAHGQRNLVIGALATAFALWGVHQFYYVDGVGYGAFMTAFGYSGVALAFALLVVAALSRGSWLFRWRVPGAERLALWSYSIYLSHKAVGHVLRDALKPFDVSPLALFVTVTLASLAAGWLLYRAVETPFMRLRERWVPGSFVKPPAAPPPARAAAPG